jgi:hypothetical protein
MRFFTLGWLSLPGTILVLFVSFVSSAHDVTRRKSHIDTITKENKEFWQRFLQTNNDLSVVTPSPTPTETCNVEVRLKCSTSDDVACININPPQLSCDNGERFDLLTFSYQGGQCTEDGNSQGSAAFCEDTLSSDFTESVFVFCFTEDGLPLDTESRLVSPGGTFTVTNPDGNELPTKVDCAIVREDDNQLQQNVIDTSGDVPLKLHDRFGALRVESCNKQSCLENINYSIDITNSGRVDLNIKDVTLTLDPETRNLFLDLVETSLGPDKSTSLKVIEAINICTNEELSALIAVTAASVNERPCQDRDEYSFTVPPFVTPSPVVASDPTSSPTRVEPIPDLPTPNPTITPTKPPILQPTPTPTIPPTELEIEEPTNLPIRPTRKPTLAPSEDSIDTTSSPTSQCVIGVDLSCRVGNGPNAGKPCDTPGVEVQYCLQRPTEATMRYNGGNCDQSENRQLLQFSCEDTNGGPSTSESAFIVVTSDDITYFEGSVEVGENYVLSDDGEAFESDMIISIYGSSNVTDTNLLQRVNYATSCNTLLEINNRFGASQLVQFLNEIQGNVTSFINATFELGVSLPNRFDGDGATLESLVSATNFAGKINLTSRVQGQLLSPGSNIAIFLNTSLDYSTRKRYTTQTTVSARSTPSGQVCQGRNVFAFEGTLLLKDLSPPICHG